MTVSAKNPYAVALGRKGGLKGGPARAAKMTPEQRSASARNAVLSRWAKRTESQASTEAQPPDLATAKSLRFQHLSTEWQSQRGARSSITETAMMPAYQSIIGMGPDAVPLILHQLRTEGDQPGQWFWALRSITGQNPVDPEDQGDFPAMAKAWIRWGEANHAG